MASLELGLGVLSSERLGKHCNDAKCRFKRANGTCAKRYIVHSNGRVCLTPDKYRLGSIK